MTDRIDGVVPVDERAICPVNRGRRSQNQLQEPGIMMDMLFPEEEMRPKSRREPPRVKFAGSGDEIAVESGTLLVDAIREAGLDVPQQCGGVAVCGWCRVRILEGMELLSEPEADERRLAGWERLGPNERASCRAEVLGDVLIDL